MCNIFVYLVEYHIANGLRVANFCRWDSIENFHEKTCKRIFVVKILRIQKKPQNFLLEINLLYSKYAYHSLLFILNSFTCRCSCGGI